MPRLDRIDLDDAYLRAIGFENATERAARLPQLHEAACRMIWTRQARHTYDEWLATGLPFGGGVEGQHARIVPTVPVPTKDVLPPEPAAPDPTGVPVLTTHTAVPAPSATPSGSRPPGGHWGGGGAAGSGAAVSANGSGHSPGGHGFGGGPGGERPEHEWLKTLIAHNPDLLGEGHTLKKVEYQYQSLDKVDVLLEDVNGLPVTVEVEAAIRPGSYVGVWQAVKYQHLAAMEYGLECRAVRTVVVAPHFPEDVLGEAERLGVECLTCPLPGSDIL